MSFIESLAYSLGKGFSEGFWTAFFEHMRKQKEFTEASYDKAATDPIVSAFDKWLQPMASGSSDLRRPEAPPPPSEPNS